MRGRAAAAMLVAAGLVLGALLALAACGGPAPTSTPPTSTAPTAFPTPAPTAASAAGTTGAITIVAMGDSLTEGLGVDMSDAYPAQLERKLKAAGYDVTVVNAGVSGETSSGALSRVDWVLKQHSAIVILATGGNDGLRGIDPEVTAQNIDQIAEKLQGGGAVVVLAGMEMVQNMGKQYTGEFRAIYPAIAKQRGTVFMPFLLEDVAGDPKLNQADTIHPTAQGYTIVADNLFPYVVQAIKQVAARQ